MGPLDITISMDPNTVELVKWVMVRYGTMVIVLIGLLILRPVLVARASRPKGK